MDSTKIFLLIVGNIVNIALSLIFFYLIRIFFDIEIVGYYGAILSFFTTFSLINDLGIQLAYLKFFAESKNTEEEALCNGTFLTFRIIQCVIYTIVMLSFIPLAPIYNGEILVVYIFFIAMLFFRVSFFEQIFLSKKEVFKNSATSILSIFLRVILLILLTYFFQSDIWLLANIILISNVSYFLVSLFLTKKRGFKKPNKEYIRKFFRYSIPFFITNSLIFIVNNIDVLLLNNWSSISNVANYFSAKQFFSYFLIITISISNILITTFSKNISNGKESENIVIVNYTHKILNLLIFPIIFLTYLYIPDFFVLIFGEQYRLTGQILLFFILLLIPLSLDIVNLVQLQALGEVKFIAKFSIIENILSIFFMILFISPAMFNLGVYGGALSFLFSKILIQLIYRPIIYKKFHLGFHWGSFRNFFIMFGILIIQLWLNNLYNFPPLILLLFTIIDILLYFSINYILKGFSKEDFKFFLNIISIRNIYRAVSEELKENE
ncbi:MAG: lipopolysaccharide biosynthesis protein [Candidatus Hodarchaeota archaeon]